MTGTSFHGVGALEHIANTHYMANHVVEDAQKAAVDIGKALSLKNLVELEHQFEHGFREVMKGIHDFGDKFVDTMIASQSKSGASR